MVSEELDRSDAQDGRQSARRSRIRDTRAKRQRNTGANVRYPRAALQGLWAVQIGEAVSHAASLINSRHEIPVFASSLRALAGVVPLSP